MSTPGAVDDGGAARAARRDVPIWSAAEAEAALGPLADRGDLATLAEVGAVIVRLDRVPSAGLAAALRRAPVVVITLGAPAVVEVARDAPQAPSAWGDVAPDAPQQPSARGDVAPDAPQQPSAWGDVAVADGPERHGDLARPWVPGGVDEARRVAAAVAAQPDAALVLVQLLRLGATLDVTEALAAESLAYGLLQAGPAHQRWLAGRPPRPVDDRPPHPRPAEAGAAADDHRDGDEDRDGNEDHEGNDRSDDNESSNGGGRRSEERVVRVERDGQTLSVTLDRPAVRNAYSALVRDQLAAALQLAAADPAVGRIVIRGAGPSFCSGGDLTEFGSATDPVAAHRVRSVSGPAGLLADLAGRVEVEVQGHAVGAGTELAAFAGRVRARADARFRLPEVTMGLVPGAGGTVSVPRRIGRERTAWLAITGDPIDAETARAWGLVDELVDHLDHLDRP